MAKYNEILTGRFNRFMQKLLSMKGPASMAQLAGELQPVFAFFNGVENRYLEGWDRFAMFFSIAGGAAIFGNGMIRNPTGSGVIAVVELFNMVVPPGAAVDAPLLRLGVQATDTTSVVVATPLDTRGRAGSTLRGSQSNTNNQLITGGQIAQFGLAANTSVVFPNDENQEIVINPGSALSVSSATANQAMTFFVWWRERAMEESELK